MSQGREPISPQTMLPSVGAAMEEIGDSEHFAVRTETRPRASMNHSVLTNAFAADIT